VQKALSAAANEAASFKYQYHKLSVTWSDAAIRFSSSATAPEGDWVDAGSALASPGGLLFARVDTSELDPAFGTVNTMFMRVISDAQATATTKGLAIAGRSSINVTPLAICALEPNKPTNARNNPGPPVNVELEEYGFRRGVGYDLMNLNSENTTPAENFVINPIDPLGAVGSPANTSAATVSPFVCAGTMPMPRVKGAIGTTIAVGRPFPLGSLFNQLNSRFDQYVGGLCNPEKAPPDFNVRAFVRDTAVPWMSVVPQGQTANSSTIGGKLWTIASPLSASVPGTTLGSAYGPLWSFAKAVPFSAYTPGVAEPSGGYATFAATNSVWGTLYTPGKPTASSYPGGTPYAASAGPNFLAPSIANRPGVRLRRVLNVPLLRCPVAAGANATAEVLGIGRFFMTVPATSTSISAEFGGVVDDQTLGGPVELLR
jgi:hypothetical protein